MVIRAEDRLSDVLARDDRMIDIFVAASPGLKGLRNSVTRKVMGRLATVGQVARIAGLEPEVLVRRVNRALEGEPDGGPPSAEAASDHPNTSEKDSMAPTSTSTTTGMPAALAAIPADLFLEVDVREDLRQGKEPFSRIMAARKQIPAGGGLRLRAIFDPVPLYMVMSRQGFTHWTEKLGDADWCVWFYPAASEAPAPSAPTSNPPASAAPDDVGEDVIVLDVRGMEPPEPMVRTLAELDTLPAGKVLLQINERIPQFLLPRLDELGFSYQIREQPEGVVRVFIRHASED